MSDVPPSRMYDVFIAYKTGADDDLAQYIGDALERSSIKVVEQRTPGAFGANSSTFQSIVDCVNNSERTLLILTKKALESSWIVLEVLHAIDHSKRRNFLTLRLLLIDVTTDDLAKLKRGILASVPYCFLDFNKDNWQEVLVKYVRVEIPLSRILPLEGSLAHGLVFSHFTGFLSHVLPELKKSIGECKIFTEEPLHVSRKYYIVLPESCQTYDTLESYDERNRILIERKDETEFHKTHAGKRRTYKLSIYKISKKTQSGCESFYFFADNPYVLNAISSMRDFGLADVDMCLQLDQFYRVLEDVVNHAQNDSCYDTVRIVRFKDNEKTMQEALFEAVQTNIAPEAIEKVLDTSRNGAESPSQIPHKRQTDECCDASVTYLREETSDSEVAENIIGYLKSNNVTVYEEKANETSLNLPKAYWHIFVLSKKVVMEPNTVLYKYFMTLHDGVCKNKLQVLLVMVGIKAEEIPHYIKWVTMVNADEPTYCEKLLKSMRGGIVRLEHRLPCGDVAIGLAWAYVINYLRITILCRSKPETGNLDLRDRIRKFLYDKNIQCGCILKMFPVLPKSCTLEDELHKKANEGLGGKEVVQYLGKLEPVYKNTGGQLGRPFYLHVYMYTDPDTQKSVCFVAEYFTPGNCLHEMAYSYPFAGLHKDEMLSQGERVVRLVPEFLNREYVKQILGDMTGLVEIIYYDDHKESLLSALRKCLSKENHVMVYADDAQ